MLIATNATMAFTMAMCVSDKYRIGRCLCRTALLSFVLIPFCEPLAAVGSTITIVASWTLLTMINLGKTIYEQKK